MASTFAIELANVSCRFGRIEALSNVSLQVPTGIVFGVVGPNGAGKSTLIDVITGVVKPGRGQASVMGFDVRRYGRQVRGLIGVMGLLLAAFQVVLILVAGSIQNSGGFEQLMALQPPFVRELMGPAFTSVMSFAETNSAATASIVVSPATTCTSCMGPQLVGVIAPEKVPSPAALALSPGAFGHCSVIPVTAPALGITNPEMSAASGRAEGGISAGVVGLAAASLSSNS